MVHSGCLIIRYHFFHFHFHLAVDGNWGAWYNSSCSHTCDGGVRSRMRDCNNPPPQNGGLLCLVPGNHRIAKEIADTEICNKNVTCPGLYFDMFFMYISFLIECER